MRHANAVQKHKRKSLSCYRIETSCWREWHDVDESPKRYRAACGDISPNSRAARKLPRRPTSCQVMVGSLGFPFAPAGIDLVAMFHPPGQIDLDRTFGMG
jgi:hypothetical protein